MKKLIIFYLILIIAFFALEIILSNLFKDCSLENTQFASIKEYYLDIHSKFFVKIIKNNEEVYTPQRAMADAAKTFLANKPSDVIRIFIVGGSVALQFNNDFEDQLKQFIPNKNIELINCAVGGYDSFRTYLVEKEILNYDPDLIIVFSGNNEFYDRNGFNVNAYHLARFLNKSFILRTLHKYLKNILNYENKGFIRDYQTRLFDYQKNIRKIICASRKRKVPILFATLPFNMRDLAPKVYSDEHSKQLLLGTYLLWHDDYENALNEFNKEKDKRDPLLFFYLGETYYGLKQFEKAKECYLKSNELAARSDWTNATFASNNIIRKVSLEEGVPYVDLEKLFINASPEGIIGMELLFDNCHWWDDIQPYVNKTIICNILKDKDRLLPHFVFNDYKINQRQPIEIKYSFEERRDNKEIVNDQSLNSVFFALYEPINSHRPEYLFKNLYFL
ncbi:MAG: SGNH/GDSL hydrolase family protein, partial [Candidatus Omnitrophica bacterium]|nr:SGNH/GDSL hydrolase family protein [Candidatus Omnitrophota bacterium]